MKPNEVSFSSQALIELIESVLSKGACFRFQVKGFSMAPFIMNNDVVIISSIDNSSIGFGQIVAFTNPRSGKLTIHRVLARNNGVYLIKGDVIFEIDGCIPKENILGLITGIERRGRRVELGLGPEKFIIGLLSRSKILPLCFWCWTLFPSAARRVIKCAMRL